MQRRSNSSLLAAAFMSAAALVGGFSSAAKEAVMSNDKSGRYTFSTRRNRGKGPHHASAKKRNKAWACGRGNEGRR